MKTPSNTSEFQARLFALEALVIELTLALYENPNTSQYRRKSVNQKLQDLQYAGIDTTGQI